MAKAARGVVQLKSGKHAGKWLVKIKLETLTPSGHPKEKRVLCDTQTQALEEKRKLEREIARGTFSTERTPLSAYVSDWLEQKKGEVKQRTVEAYSHAFRVHLLPRLGTAQLGKLRTPQVQSALNTISEAVSPSQANRCRRALHACLQDAWRSGLIPLNPVSPVRPKKETPREKVLWTPLELARFLETARDHRLYPAFHLVAVTGLRRGELLGLRWTDLVGNVLSVRQQVAPDGGGKRLETPKSRRSVRAVVLDPDTLALLEGWKAQQQREKQDLGAAWGEAKEYGELIFRTETGTAYIPRNFDHAWKRLKQRAGVPLGMRLHSMRDLTSSQLLAAGFNVNEVADRMGHEPTVLLKTYAHTLPERREAMARPLSERLPKPDPATLN